MLNRWMHHFVRQESDEFEIGAALHERLVVEDAPTIRGQGPCAPLSFLLHGHPQSQRPEEGMIQDERRTGGAQSLSYIVHGVHAASEEVGPMKPAIRGWICAASRATSRRTEGTSRRSCGSRLAIILSARLRKSSSWESPVRFKPGKMAQRSARPVMSVSRNTAFLSESRMTMREMWL